MHLSLHVPTISALTVWDLPLWAWRQYVEWQDAHLERENKRREKGVRGCEHC